MADDAVWSELLSDLQEGSLCHAVVYRKDFWRRRFTELLPKFNWGSTLWP